MPDLTTNIGLKKPLGNETADIDMINENMDIIDAEVAKKASPTQDGRMSKEDKTKLDSIEDNANNYQHPSVHPATMITEDSTHRFVTDSEKSAWNAKLNASSYTASDVLAKIKTVDGSGSGLDADTLDGKHATSFMNAIAVYQSSPAIDPNTTQDSYILTNHANSPSSSSYWHIQTFFYSSRSGNRSQVAIRYNGSYDEMYIRSYYGGTWTSWKRVWHSGNDGSGSGLDADLLDGWHRDSIRDWNNLLNKPSSLPANGGNSDTVDGLHFRVYNGSLQYYYEGVWKDVMASPIKSIQRGTSVGGFNTDNDITINTVNPEKCVVILNGDWSHSSADYNTSPYLYSITATTLKIRGDSESYTRTYSWQVIEYN